jgi:integrase
MLDAPRPLETKSRHETALKTRAFAGRVFRHAVLTARARTNPAQALRGALTAPKVTHLEAILEPAQAGALMRTIEGYDGQPATRLALQLMAHLFVRPGELRQARWPEIDFEAAVWRIPATRMKMKREHVVPLSRQALVVFRQVQAIHPGGPLVFPSLGSLDRPMSENTMNAALRRLGYAKGEMPSHGFRAMASTLLNESGKWTPDAIERALAHADSEGVRAAYHRGAHWQERVKMMRWWSDHLDALRTGAQILELRKGG